MSSLDTLILESQDRASTRRAVGTECQVVTEDGFSLVASRTLDVSSDGLLAAADTLPEIGTPLVVSLRIPGTRLWVGAEAEATRVVAGRREGEWTSALGIRFTRMDATERAVLRGHLVGRPPITPARAPRRNYADAVRRIAVRAFEK